MKHRTPSAGEKHGNKAAVRKLPSSVVPGVEVREESGWRRPEGQEVSLKGMQLADNSLGLQVHLKNNCILVTLTTDLPREREYIHS